MATVIDFGNRAVANLQARVAAVEADNRDLVAFARGHWGAVSSIQDAVLAAVGAGDLQGLADAVVRDWPMLLGVDAVAFAWIDDRAAYRADLDGLSAVERQWLDRAVAGADPVQLRSVPRGHPLFGADAGAIHGEALVRLDGRDGRVIGLLAIGQAHPLGFEEVAGTELLVFLGRVVSGMIARCQTTPRSISRPN